MSTADTERHPFTTPVVSDASMFIQWKNTDVCLDFDCPCGQRGHYDGYFASFLHCPTCGAIFQLGTQVIVKRDEDRNPSDLAVKTLDVTD